MTKSATTSLLDHANLDRRNSVRNELTPGTFRAPMMANCFWNTARPKR